MRNLNSHPPPHLDLSNTCHDCVERYQITSDDRVLALAALSFDLSVFDLFGIVAIAGGAMVIPEPKQEMNPKDWLDLMEAHHVTVWNTAPPVMTMLLDYVLQTPRTVARFKALSLRLVLLSGDFISLEIPKHLYSLLPQCELVSMGGATEASIWSCWHPIACPDEDGVFPYSVSIPYGTALANQSLHVLSLNNLQPVPLLVEGEIVIGGVGLAKNYHNDDEKTSKAFVHSKW